VGAITLRDAGEPVTDSNFQTRIEAIGGLLHHYDPAQLVFMLAEIVGDRTYLRHGVDVREGDVVLDVGANVGVSAAFFAGECRAGLVHSFEPVPPIFELLVENVRPWPACVAHNYGLSAAEGRSPITYYPGAAAMSGLYADPAEDQARVHAYLVNSGVPQGEAVQRLEGAYRPVTLSCELRPLSMVLREQRLEHVDLLKIDVEKAELDVLAGLDERDWPRIKQVVAELHGDEAHVATVARILSTRGFSVTTEQEALWRDTGVHMLYATRA
jgi:FkbM family methyltransferase